MHTTARILSCCCLLLFFSGPCNMLNGQTLNSSGELVISTDVGTDVVNISIVGNEVEVVVNGELSMFPVADVASLTVSTGVNADTIRNDTAIPMVADGGDGSDSIYGGFGDDELDGGRGPDNLFGRDGNDVLDGGIGNDNVYGGNGDDILDQHATFGSFGADRLFGGNGDDVLNDANNPVGLGSELHGGAGNDIISGHDEDDLITGGPGDDEIDAGSGNDTIFGNAGADIIETGDGDDVADGGPGLDFVDGIPVDPLIVQEANGDVFAYGGDSKNIITVSEQGNLLVVEIQTGSDILRSEFGLASVGLLDLNGGAGNDQIVNFSSIDADFSGGKGNDVLMNEGSGAAIMDGNQGDDVYQTSTDNDIVSTEDHGSDIFLLNGGEVDFTIGLADTEVFNGILVFGSSRNERVTFSVTTFQDSAVKELSHINMGPGDDTVRLQGNRSAPVVVRAGAGNDVVVGGLSANFERIFGDGGDDFLAGASMVLDGNESIFGGAGNDIICAGLISASQNDTNVLQGGPGDDILEGAGGRDLMFGGLGNDMLDGRSGDDVLRGEGGNDILLGSAGDDLLFGGPGDDVLSGGSGDDRLQGDAGNDTLDGGPGNDVEIQ